MLWSSNAAEADDPMQTTANIILRQGNEGKEWKTIKVRCQGVRVRRTRKESMVWSVVQW